MGEREIFFVFPIRGFVPSLHKVMESRKMAGAQVGNVHHISITQHNIFLPFTIVILPPLSHSINVLNHSIASRAVLTPQ